MINPRQESCILSFAKSLVDRRIHNLQQCDRTQDKEVCGSPQMQLHAVDSTARKHFGESQLKLLVVSDTHSRLR
jgi:hypothetical protein